MVARGKSSGVHADCKQHINDMMSHFSQNPLEAIESTPDRMKDRSVSAFLDDMAPASQSRNRRII